MIQYIFSKFYKIALISFEIQSTPFYLYHTLQYRSNCITRMYVSLESVTEHLVLQIIPMNLCYKLTYTVVLHQDFKNSINTNYHNSCPLTKIPNIVPNTSYLACNFMCVNLFNLIYATNFCELLIRHIVRNYFAILLQLMNGFT